MQTKNIFKLIAEIPKRYYTQLVVDSKPKKSSWIKGHINKQKQMFAMCIKRTINVVTTDVRATPLKRHGRGGGKSPWPPRTKLGFFQPLAKNGYFPYPPSDTKQDFFTLLGHVFFLGPTDSFVQFYPPQDKNLQFFTPWSKTMIFSTPLRQGDLTPWPSDKKAISSSLLLF